MRRPSPESVLPESSPPEIVPSQDEAGGDDCARGSDFVALGQGCALVPTTIVLSPTALRLMSGTVFPSYDRTTNAAYVGDGVSELRPYNSDSASDN